MKIKVLTLDEALELAKKLLRSRGFEVTSRSDESFYFKKLGYRRKIRLSTHKRRFYSSDADISYDLVIDQKTIISDIEYQVKKAMTYVIPLYEKKIK